MKKKTFALLMMTMVSISLISGCGQKTEVKKESEETVQETEDSNENVVLSDDGDDFVEETVLETTEEDTDKTADSSETEGSTDLVDAGVVEGPISELDTSVNLTGMHHAEIVMKDLGSIMIELNADSAPITVTNFVKLVQDDFYDGLTFHRIIDGFMMQGGDPLGNGTGGSKENIKGEFSENGVKNNLSHARGAISMARAAAPDSASSQFFIVQTDSHFLDGNYAVFGYVTDGMDIVDAVCETAEPIDDNGLISKEEQPVILDIKILD